MTFVQIFAALQKLSTRAKALVSPGINTSLRTCITAMANRFVRKNVTGRSGRFSFRAPGFSSTACDGNVTLCMGWYINFFKIAYV